MPCLLVGARSGTGTAMHIALSIACALPIHCQSGEAAAETLAEVLAAARDFNPRIASERAKASATDEGVPQARALALPKVSADANYGLQSDARHPSLARDNSSQPFGYDVTLVQPLFDGGRAASSVRAAKANSKAQSENVRVVMQQVLLAAVTAYSDVRHDRQVARFNRESLALLQQTARTVRRRAAVHEATMADVAQADAALASAQAQLELALANQASSEAAFEEAVTHAPGQLQPPPGIERFLPASREDAILQARKESPVVIEAVYRTQAAQHQIDVARSQYLPSVNFQAGYQRNVGPPLTVGDQNDLIAKVVVSIPLYTGGAVESEVRQARYNSVASKYQLADMTAQARTGVAQAWARVKAAKAAQESVAAQLAANRRALTGVREEQRLGQRAVQELLNAQQAVLASQIAREQIERNRVVDEFTLLALVGGLDPSVLEIDSASGNTDAAAAERRTWKVTVNRDDQSLKGDRKSIR